MNEIRTSGVICTKDKYSFIYKIARIDYFEYKNGDYKYEFTPFYNVIDMLPPTIFQGIPGLDLSKRKAVYERINTTPTFISERTPGENRENLYELLAEYGMDYLNRLEWLIRSKTRYSGDRFFVKRYESSDDGKVFSVDSINDLVKRSDLINKKLLDIICYGNALICNEFEINDSNREEYYKLLMPLYINAQEHKKANQLEGINRRKNNGGYKGRKKIMIDEITLHSVLDDFIAKRISEDEALNKLNISRSTFYRRLKEYENR